MESYNSVELEDYWNEVKTLRYHRNSSQSCISEDDSRSHDGKSSIPFLNILIKSFYFMPYLSLIFKNKYVNNLIVHT